MSRHFLMLLILNVLFLFGNSVGSVNPKFEACEPKTCGNGQAISYPFHIDGKQDLFCGFPLFRLFCAPNGFPLLNLSNSFYIVQEISYSTRSLRVSNPNFPISNATTCLSPTKNLTLSGNRFSFASHQKEALLFFNCDLSSLPEGLQENRVGCFAENKTSSVLGLAMDDEDNKLRYAKKNCRGEVMSTVVKDEEGGIREALRRGFVLIWTASECEECESSGGRCGFDLDAYSFRCFCRDGDQLLRCHSEETGKSMVIAATAGCGNGNRDKCPRSFDCGELGRIHFSFTKAERQGCGLMVIYGCDDPSPNKTIELEKNGRPLRLTNIIQQDNAITVTDEDLHKRLKSKTCEVLNRNITLPQGSPLVSFHFKYNITLFRCNQNLNISPPAGVFNYTCPDYNIYHYHLHKHPSDHYQRSFSSCSILLLPSKDQPDTKDLLSSLTAQMVIEVQLSDACDKCYNHIGGQCRLDSNRNFYCDREKTGKTVLIVTTASSAGLAMLLFLGLCFRRKLLALATFNCFWRKKHPTHQIIEDSLKQHGPISSRRYSYSKIKKVTNYFKVKLGKGGYGSVYKGKLPDGRLVAVKVLSELKGTNEEFVNEVASISKTSHLNIVSLLGFCFQGSKRALVYEFMPNGSLEKFIYEKDPNMVEHQLDCQTLYNIAIGVARGLEYLHEGCNSTKILHFDIKPHNILLDEDFCPKISDFGLAKVCPTKDRIVSILGARGTARYIAPEVFSRNFGEVSHKSDVYSYGMMVLEMVGRRKNMNVEVDHASEIYFPHWIYKRLKLNRELGLRCIRNDIDKEKMRKMTVVSSWCIQTDPSMRPAMSKVVEMLEGSLESMQVPPKPFLYSPSTSPAHYTTRTCKTL